MDAVKVIETTLGTGPCTKSGPMFMVFEWLLRAVIPAANPDFERSYDKITKWWIEVNVAGEPQRELGFGERGEVIVAGPMGRNFGFFTDSNMVFEPDDCPEVEQAAFESLWSEFERRWSEQQRPQA